MKIPFFLGLDKFNFVCIFYPMIELKNITKNFNNVKAVDNVSFSVKKGEIVGFLGPNGAGKTTTMRLITGFLHPDEGSIKVKDMDVSVEPIKTKSFIGYLPENNPLYNDMYVYEYLDVIANLREIEKEKKKFRIEEVVHLAGLSEVMGRMIGELSRGFRQRVGIAQAMIHNPDILLLDEPTSGLDPLQVVEMRELIKSLAKQKTLIISTHILSEAETTSTRVLIINKGKIVADEMKENLSKLSTGQEWLRLEIKGDREKIINAIEKFGKVEVENENDGIISLSLRTSEDVREEIYNVSVKNKFIIIEMHRKVASLEDVFKELTK